MPCSRWPPPNCVGDAAWEAANGNKACARGLIDESICTDGFSLEYAGTNCVGDAAWEAANGNKACDCVGGVCRNCCKEDSAPNGDWSCFWQDPETAWANE